jgi:Predicted site-specific integrase-resolvase
VPSLHACRSTLEDPPQKDDLERQKQLIHSYAKEKGCGEVQILGDVASGLNENRKGFLRLLEMVAERKVSKVIIVYEDRLTRFGFKTLRKMFQAFGTEGTELEFVIMVIAVSCVKLLSAHNSTQHTSRKHKV